MLEAYVGRVGRWCRMGVTPLDGPLIRGFSVNEPLILL